MSDRKIEILSRTGDNLIECAKIINLDPMQISRS